MPGKNLNMRIAVSAVAILCSAVPVSCAVFVSTPQQSVAKSDKQARVADWFGRYDQIRHEAQMSDAEKERSRGLMAQGLAASFMKSPDSAQEKAAANALLRKMVQRYQRASAQMDSLPRLAETKKLHDGYRQYFQTAGALFGDYLKVQNNLFATDAAGNGLMGQLSQRKSDLEALDAANKELDGRLRDKFGVAPYAY